MTGTETNESLVARYQAGDESALPLLLSRNHWGLFKLARKFAGGDLLDDAMQEARIALMDCAAPGRFDPARGLMFTTYAWAAIFRRLRRWRKDQALVHSPYHWPRKDCVRTLSAHTLGITQPGTGDWFGTRPAGDMRPDEIVADADETEQQRQTVQRRMLLLDDRCQTIIRAHFEGRTLEDIGQEIGITRERVRQLLMRSMAVLRGHRVPPDPLRVESRSPGYVKAKTLRREAVVA